MFVCQDQVVIDRISACELDVLCFLTTVPLEILPLLTWQCLRHSTCEGAGRQQFRAIVTRKT